MFADLPASVTVLAQSIVAIVAIVLAVAVWRWLRVALASGQLAAENAALAQLAAYASVFVAAAEQTLDKSPGFAKLDWVLAQFERVLPDLDKDLVRSYVEAAVAGLPRNQPAPPPAITFTGTPSSPPPPVNCDDLAPVQPSTPAAISHSNQKSKGVKLPGAA